MKIFKQISTQGQKNGHPLRFWWKGNRNYILAGILCICMFSLTGCNPYAGYFFYEIEYPSGRVVNAYYWRDNPTIEDSNLSLSIEYRIEGEEKSVIKLLGEDGEELWVKETEQPYYRGQVVDGELWVCEEVWRGILAGFYDGLLESGKISCVEITTGETKWEQATGENEFFLFKREERFYFYQRGEMRKWGKSEYAHLYYRTMEEWEEKHLIYEFDYAEKPEDADSWCIMKFVIQEDAIVVEYWNGSYEMAEMLWTIEVPLQTERE